MSFYLQFLFQISLGGEEFYTVGGINEKLLNGRKGVNSLQAIRIWIRRRFRFRKKSNKSQNKQIVIQKSNKLNYIVIVDKDT